MDTNPARAPFIVIVASAFLNLIQEVIIARIAPAAADRFVVTAIVAKSAPPTAVVLPGLNPNQPSHRIKTPSVAIGMLWPCIR